MKPREEQFDKYASKAGDSEPHYKDSDFTACPDCGVRGRMSQDIKGKPTFYHRVSKGNGMFGFEEGHK